MKVWEGSGRREGRGGRGGEGRGGEGSEEWGGELVRSGEGSW